jgi:Mg-chelatase subunit ChlD
VACRRPARNLAARAAEPDPHVTLPGDSLERAPLLAVQALGIEFALEAGRVYALGSDDACDLGCGAPDLPPVALRLWLHGDAAVVLGADGSRIAELRQGADVAFSGLRLCIVADTGNARILPVPELRAARARRLRASTAPARAVRARHADSFKELMARELQHAPWLTLSLAVHALLLLLLWWLFPAAPIGGAPSARFGYAGDPGNAVASAVAPSAPDVVAEPSEMLEPALPPPQPAAGADPGGDEPPEPAPRHDLRNVGNVRVAARAAGPDGLDPGSVPAGTGAFRQTVVQLRDSGLDVVFVLDSTGSMGNSIAAAKEGIASMLDVLRALVPGARFGLVTYRDHGRAEDYLLRVLPIDRDFYAAVNFVHSVEAGGGGDVPEAVRAGLRAAFDQPFRPGARRVVVLAGDAPPHRRDEGPLLSDVRRFVQTKGSFVHALVTSKRDGGDDASQSFQRIAENGRGICAHVEDHGRILKQVLAVTFGAEHATDLESVHRRLDASRRDTPTWALELARKGGPQLVRAFAAHSVPPVLVQALVRRPRRHVACELAELLASESIPDAGRQAAAHVLQQQLGLEVAPIDPERPRPLADRRVAELRRLAASLPE